MRAITLIFLVFLTGCAARGALVWEHSHGHDDRQLRQAQQECRQLAHREARYPFFYYKDPLFHFHRPFNYHGRYYASDLFWNDHFAQLRYQEDVSRLYRICMEAKGWRLVRLEAPDEGSDDEAIRNE